MGDEKYLGFVKYEGELVEDGLMDARKQAQALLGVDSAIRYFVGKQAPQFKNLEYEIPVQVRKGSWELLIPETVAGWVQAGLGVVATGYFTKAAQKMAEKDFENIGVKELFSKSIEAIKWFARIGKHMGDLSIRSFENVRFSDDNALIGICNAKGEYLYVPKSHLDFYVASNSNLLELLALNIEEGRELTIGTELENELDTVSITIRDKYIFCTDEDEQDEDVLFPEMVHGDTVVLEGEVTRENKTSNSMGFKYQDHILTAYPESGSIVPYKRLLFLRCQLYATVSRLNEKGRVGARRPKLYFSHIEPLEDHIVGDLFDD